MATLTVQDIDLGTGLAPTYVSADAAGDQYANDGRTYLHIKSTHGSAHTVTVTPVATAIDDPQFGRIVPAARTFTVAGGAERILPFFGQAGYNNANNRVAVTYSAVSGLTVAAIRTPQAQA
ncbi:MAG: hypothetical protein ACK5X3_05380 [Pseudomonadota bacterium]|jgi:hypothetical protein